MLLLNRKLFLLLSFVFISSQIVLSQDFNSQEIEIITGAEPRILTTERPEDNEILLRKSDDISPGAPGLPALIRVLNEMVAREEGVGIAAPQIGISRNVFLIQRFDKPEQPFEEFINPRILWTSELYKQGSEGCLSIPDFRADIWRHYAIQVEYDQLGGETETEIIEGFTAVIFQHEFDHLQGRLITDSAHIENDSRIKIIGQAMGIMEQD